MSCHYSCASCSGSVYLDLCTACPLTRTLTDTMCLCSDGNYEYQTSTCVASSSIGNFDNFLIGMSNVSMYVAVGLHLLIIVFTMNRLFSAKLKKVIDTMQVVGLVAYYRFRQEEVAERALKVANVFNFNYFNMLICNRQSLPSTCQTFQHLIGPGLTLLAFILLFFLSYIVAGCIYYGSKDDDNVVYIRDGVQERGNGRATLSIGLYWQTVKSSFIFLYLDQTAVQTSVALSQIVKTNTIGVLFVIPFLVLVVLAGRMQFKAINDQKQTTLIYRAEHSYFYLYDKFYHLNYIDHLFQQDNLKKDKKSLKKYFYPQSNLIIMELLFKIFLATSTIIFYQYEPYLFAFVCIFLLVVFAYMMDHLFYYQRWTLIFFIYCTLAHIYSVSTFFISSAFTYFICFFVVSNLVLMMFFMVMVIDSWRNEREGEMLNKIYMMKGAKKIANDQSEEEMTSEKEFSDTDQVSYHPVALAKKQENRSNVTANRSVFPRRTRPSAMGGLSKKEGEEGGKEEKQPTAKVEEGTLRNTRRSQRKSLSKLNDEKEEKQKKELDKINEEKEEEKEEPKKSEKQSEAKKSERKEKQQSKKSERKEKEEQKKSEKKEKYQSKKSAKNEQKQSEAKKQESKKQEAVSKKKTLNISELQSQK